MKVAFVTPYWRPVVGGVTTYVVRLAEELRQTAGLELLVIAREGGAPGAITLGGSAREFAARAAAALERFGPDVVHAHGHWYALQAALRYRSRHRSTRVVFTAYTEFRRESLVRRLALGRLLSRADFLTAVSLDLLGRTLRDLGVRTRTRVTPPGVTGGPASVEAIEAFREEHQLPGKYVAWLGPLVHREKVRGLEHLIKAMRLVRERFPEVGLVIGGDGELRDRVEGLARRELGPGCRFLGALADPNPFLTAADVVAHISFQEGLPLALLEAMACARPIVASSVGGIPEVLVEGRNGLLTTGEVPELADRLASLLASPEASRRLGMQASRDVAIRWNWVGATRRFLPLYGGRSSRRIVVSVDLEKDYHTATVRFRGVEEALPKLLEVFARHRITAECFATADLCERYPDALIRTKKAGHILGCHGESHDIPYLSAKSAAWQARSLGKATQSLTDLLGARPRGFRAPNFSANAATLRTLRQLGYAYDSSILPGRVVRKRRAITVLDHRVAPRDPYVPAEDDPTLPGRTGLLEFPVTENPHALGGPIGLGFLHAFGVEKALDAVAASAGDPCVFLIHPWELVEPPEGKIPAWMRTGCSPDPAPLDRFLTGLAKAHTFTTFDQELAGFTSSRG